ncbi:hypothetical protein [Leptospira wolffii]|uniref:hypothetical protein n=1 Tax=Leptospira wolffii TaxID=409998 RepID=UPI0002FB2067|nr:hypothetical protein [Leptospira wolffii]EPG67907.1 hypothetical protein LEP1GSC061_0965 [Leptospira wolffii serovar Khorat str. Khorat-H2]
MNLKMDYEFSVENSEFELRIPKTDYVGRITGHAMGKDFGPHGVANLNIGKSIQRATFVSHDRLRRFENREFGNWLERSFFISHDRWRKLENRELGRIVGSEKIRNWVKDNVNTDLLMKSGFCSAMEFTGLCGQRYELYKHNCSGVRDIVQKVNDTLELIFVLIPLLNKEGALASIIGKDAAQGY